MPGSKNIYLRYLIQTFVALVFLSCVMNVKAESTLYKRAVMAPYGPNPSDTNEIRTLFYQNQARGLISYYHTYPNPGFFANELESFSKVLRIELETQSQRSSLLLNILRVLNTFHDEPKEVRFAIIQSLSNKQLYDLTWYWYRALYTSSINGVLDQILKNSLAENNLYREIFADGFLGLQSILQSASNYNRLQDFLSLFEQNEKKHLFDVMLSGMEQSGRADYLVTLMEWLEIASEPMREHIFSRVLERIDLLEQGTPLKELPLARFQEPPAWTLSQEVSLPVDDLYLIFVEGVHFFNKHQNPFQFLNSHHTASFLDATYPMIYHGYERFWKSFSKLKPTDVFNETSEHLQRHLFYNDSDGWATYLNFKRRYERNTAWRIREFRTFLELSRNEKGRKIKIIANKPNSYTRTRNEIEKLYGELKPEAFIHRGHSYHLHKGLDTVKENTQLAILGSCGGGENISKILNLAQETQIILSRGKGTVWVNEILLETIYDSIALNGEINWVNIRGEVKRNLALLKQKRPHIDLGRNLKVFQEYYQLPNENIGLLLTYAIHKKLRQPAQKFTWVRN